MRGKHSKESKIFKFQKKETKIKNDNSKKMSIFEKFLFLVFIIIFVISGITLLKWFLDTSKSEETYKELAKKVNIHTEENKENENQNNSPINFDELKKINPDIVAWIKINRTTIDYPILQKNDNSYYLAKNFYNENDRTGAIFLDYKNKKDFTDKNTVIYGHNIKRGTMFADLVNIYNGSLGDNVEINIYIPDKILKYKVFSSYNVDPEDYSINTSISEKDFKNFKQTLIQKSERKFEEYFNGKNQILTLSTCDRTGKKRILVHAEQVNP